MLTTIDTHFTNTCSELFCYSHTCAAYSSCFSYFFHHRKHRPCLVQLSHVMQLYMYTHAKNKHKTMQLHLHIYVCQKVDIPVDLCTLSLWTLFVFTPDDTAHKELYKVVKLPHVLCTLYYSASAAIPVPRLSTYMYSTTEVLMCLQNTQ